MGFEKIPPLWISVDLEIRIIKRVLHNPHIYRTGVSPLDAVSCLTQDTPPFFFLVGEYFSVGVRVNGQEYCLY